MLLQTGDVYVDVWYTQDGYNASIIPAEKMTPTPGGFFEMVYAEEDVMVHLGPYSDEKAALAGAIEWLKQKGPQSQRETPIS